MNADISDEIKEKLSLIEKEKDFYQNMKPPKKIQMFLGITFLALSTVSIMNKNLYQLALFLLLSLVCIGSYFDYARLYKIHSNACDIISYYKKRETARKT